jgi:hypothetical protein
MHFSRLGPATRLPCPLGWTRYCLSLSRSVGKSSKASSSVPLPYSRCRFGFLSTFGAEVDALELPVPERERKLSEDGGRGGMGEVARGVTEDEGGKTDDIEGRAFRREDDVGIVNRSAAGFEDGVGGRVGGTP